MNTSDVRLFIDGVRVVFRSEDLELVEALLKLREAQVTSCASAEKYFKEKYASQFENTGRKSDGVGADTKHE